jgi:hypothetical protein
VTSRCLAVVDPQFSVRRILMVGANRHLELAADLAGLDEDARNVSAGAYPVRLVGSDEPAELVDDDLLVEMRRRSLSEDPDRLTRDHVGSQFVMGRRSNSRASSSSSMRSER